MANAIAKMDAAPLASSAPSNPMQLPGIYYDLPAAEYHAVPAISSSILKRLYISSPKHVHERPFEATEAMDLGTAFHAFLLDRDFHRRFFVLPDKNENWSTKAGKKEKAAHDSIREMNANKSPISAYAMQQIEAAFNAFQDHPFGMMIARDIAVKSARTEVSVFWNEDDIGLCKARFDILNMPPAEASPNVRKIIDPKTTRCAHPKKFQWDILPTKDGLNYWIQAAWHYRGAKANGLDIDQFEFVAVEMEKPYGISFFYLDEPELQSHQMTVRRLAETWAKSLKTNEFPCYPIVRHCITAGDNDE